MAIVNATNGTNVFNWQEFNDLLTSLGIFKTSSINHFKLTCGMNEDYAVIDGELVFDKQHNTIDGTFHSEEYKALCRKLGAVNIEMAKRVILQAVKWVKYLKRVFSVMRY